MQGQWLGGSTACHSSCVFKERKKVHNSARSVILRIKEQVWYADSPSQLSNISLETTDEPPSQLNLYSFKSGPVFCILKIKVSFDPLIFPDRLIDHCHILKLTELPALFSEDNYFFLKMYIVLEFHFVGRL